MTSSPWFIMYIIFSALKCIVFMLAYFGNDDSKIAPFYDDNAMEIMGKIFCAILWIGFWPIVSFYCGFKDLFKWSAGI